jgi:hypothetical protein
VRNQGQANAYQAPAGQAVYDIGLPNQITTITPNPSTGQLVFDGIYHVRGSLRFAKGTAAPQPRCVAAATRPTTA